MLLIVGCAGDAANNSKHHAKSVVHAVNRVCHPAATAPVPAFAFQNCVEHGARSELRHHALQRPRVRFLFQRAFPQKIFHVMFAGEGAIPLITELSLVLFFRGFHPSNCNLGPERTVQPAVESSA